MIFTVICREDVDRTLAAKVSIWLWKNGIGKEEHAEFYVWGDHTKA